MFELLLDGVPGHRTYLPDYIKLQEKHDIMGLGTKEVISETFPLHHQKVFYMSYYRKKIEGFVRLRELKESIENKEQKSVPLPHRKGVVFIEDQDLPKWNCYACLRNPPYYAETLTECAL